MSSSIFFKYKSQKEPSQITFDGTSLSVFEVKREIIAYSKLGDGTDFDLEIYTSDTNEREYPTHVICDPLHTDKTKATTMTPYKSHAPPPSLLVVSLLPSLAPVEPRAMSLARCPSMLKISTVSSPCVQSRTRVHQ